MTPRLVPCLRHSVSQGIRRSLGGTPPYDEVHQPIINLVEAGKYKLTKKLFIAMRSVLDAHPDKKIVPHDP